MGKSKVIILLSICYLNLFAVDMGSIQKELKQCGKDKSNDALEQGVVSWINSVDSVKKCDEKKINFLSSNDILLTRKADLSLLKLNHENCSAVKELSQLFTSRESKILDFKKELDNCGKKAKEKNFIEKIEALKKTYIEAKETLKSLKEDEDSINKVIAIEKSKSTGDEEKLRKALNYKKNLKLKIEEVKTNIKSMEEKLDNS